MRQGDFWCPEVELLLWQFSLASPFAKSQKMADFGVFGKISNNSALPAVLEAQFAPESSPILAL